MILKESDVRSTPIEFFNYWNNIFKFKLDVCANSENAKCEKFFGVNENGLEKEWDDVNWCNPPYSSGQINLWLKKGRIEQLKGKTTVFLIPCDTSTNWYQGNILTNEKASIIPIKGRLKFQGSETGAKFGSHIVIFWGLR